MATIDNVEIPSLLFDEQGSAPSTPASGKWRHYFKSTGLFVKDDAGVETGPLGTGGGSTTNRGARVYRSGALSVANNEGTPTPIAFDAETYDTNTLHDNSTNPERVVLNAVGKWLCTWQIAYSGNTTGFRNAVLQLNGTNYNVQSKPTWAGGTMMLGGTDLVNATAITDYVTAAPYQDSGGSLALTVGTAYTFLAVTYLGT